MSNENQIKPTWVVQLAAKAESMREFYLTSLDSREPFNEIPEPIPDSEPDEDIICAHCHFPEWFCDCSRYDSEGNEL